MKYYEFLLEILCRIQNIENTLKVLGQSQLSVESKIEQMCLLEEIKHEIITHDLVGESLANALSETDNLNSWPLKLIEKMYKDNSIVPLDLVKSLSRTKIECRNLWQLSHSEVSYLKNLKDSFTDLIKFTRELACLRSQHLKYSKYDSFLTVDFTEKNIKEIFPQIGKFFSKNVDKISENQSKGKVLHMKNFTREKQLELGSVYLGQVGMNINEVRGYYDYVSTPIDYCESNFCYSLFSLLRYSSDIMYQKYLAQNASKITPVICETQRLFMEKVLGTSKEFVEFIQPHMKEKFFNKSGFQTKVSSVDNLYLIFNRINVSPYLKQADQFTLLAHLMLRTKLEQDMVNGKLEVQDLHDAWLEGMKHYKILFKAENELDTYFQDEYWASGIIGYFPTKVIALVAAAQIFSFIKENYCESLNAVVKGNFSLLMNWLSNNIYNTGCGIFEMLEKITGKSLDIECYTNYLSKKYGIFD